MFSFIFEIISSIWDFIKHIFVQIVSFVKNIFSFFKNRNRMQKLQQDKNVVATTIKQNLEDGSVNVINCLCDKNRGEVIDYEEDAVGIEAEDLDSETRRAFGNKDMIILQ